MGELRNLKARIEELENDLRERDEEVKVLKEQQMQNGGGRAGGDDSEAVKVTFFLTFANYTYLFPLSDALFRKRRPEEDLGQDPEPAGHHEEYGLLTRAYTATQAPSVLTGPSILASA